MTVLFPRPLSPQRGLHLGDRNLDTTELGEHALGFFNRLAQRLSVRGCASLDLLGEVARRLSARPADCQRTFVRFDQLQDFELLFVFHACGYAVE